MACIICAWYMPIDLHINSPKPGLIQYKSSWRCNSTSLCFLQALEFDYSLVEYGELVSEDVELKKKKKKKMWNLHWIPVDLA